MTDILTVKDLSKKLKVNKRLIYLFARQRQIPGAFRFGKQWRFDADMIEQWIKEQIKFQQTAK